MGAVKKVYDLEFCHFATENPGKFLVHQQHAYALWKEQWQSTFQELSITKKLFSDEFRHKELGGLFLGEQPIGFLLYEFLDLDRTVHADLRYFENYPHQLMSRNGSLRDQVMVITFMTLDCEWRKSRTDLPISELLTGFSVLRFLNSPAARLIGYFRNNRGTNEMFYRHGGQPLLAVDKHAYNVEVDFAEIPRASARLSSLPHCADATLFLWQQFTQKEEGKYDEIKRITGSEDESPGEQDRELALG